MWDIDEMYSDYGCMRHRSFVEIFPDVNTFLDDYQNNGIEQTINTAEATTLYYLLYSKYGNSTIASDDENQFKYKVFATIFQYGPTWSKELTIQKDIRGLSEEELLQGGTRITNRALNPDVEPTSQATSELPFITEQNVSKSKRGKVEQYAIVLDLLKRDVSEYFLAKFKPLFMTIVAPERALWYVEE